MGKEIDILVVEDDPHDMELTVRVFKEHNLMNAIHTADDGEKALEYLFPSDAGESVRRPRFVLLDLKLPKVDGLEVLQRIKSDPRTRTIPVVILTSSKEAPDLKAAYELGANSYLCKPVEFQDFVNVIRQIGLYWVLLNEPPE